MLHSSLARKRAATTPSSVNEWYRISAPGIIDGITDMDWDSFHAATQVVIEKQHSFYFESRKEFTRSGKSYSYVGKILFLQDDLGVDHAAVFLCSPNVHTIEEMYDQRLSIKDLKGRDDCRMQMLLNQSNVEYFQATSAEVCYAIKQRYFSL